MNSFAVDGIMIIFLACEAFI